MAAVSLACGARQRIMKLFFLMNVFTMRP